MPLTLRGRVRLKISAVQATLALLLAPLGQGAPKDVGVSLEILGARACPGTLELVAKITFLNRGGSKVLVPYLDATYIQVAQSRADLDGRNFEIRQVSDTGAVSLSGPQKLPVDVLAPHRSISITRNLNIFYKRDPKGAHQLRLGLTTPHLGPYPEAGFRSMLYSAWVDGLLIIPEGASSACSTPTSQGTD